MKMMVELQYNHLKELKAIEAQHILNPPCPTSSSIDVKIFAKDKIGQARN